ncbi:MAG: (Fe-S)-binding protein [Candidatus Dadabacteria bacterium]|nr:MAG: (Fe-S)-binding protein [Candidatus Dadabacteria bacterium]
MPTVFAPGCALWIHDPDLARATFEILRHRIPDLEVHTICCRHDPNRPAGTRVVNLCPGCDRRYRERYDGISTVSLWEILAEDRAFSFPDYGGRRMAIHDACPTRDRSRVQAAIRALLRRMNVDLVEPEHTRDRSRCCGDSLYGTLPPAGVRERMTKRASEMPTEEVVVYCVSCIKAMHNGGKRPRYLLDLLFGKPTPPGTSDPDRWHAQLDAFIAHH